MNPGRAITSGARHATAFDALTASDLEQLEIMAEFHITGVLQRHKRNSQHQKQEAQRHYEPHLPPEVSGARENQRSQASLTRKLHAVRDAACEAANADEVDEVRRARSQMEDDSNQLFKGGEGLDDVILLAERQRSGTLDRESSKAQQRHAAASHDDRSEHDAAVKDLKSQHGEALKILKQVFDDAREVEVHPAYRQAKYMGPVLQTDTGRLSPTLLVLHGESLSIGIGVRWTRIKLSLVSGPPAPTR
ncbi:hypothetical protein LTR86_002272 [Recurvomyces mirabilis]|nr:hypothetical protein LTR86_002272 [Recurvomyces mirabilis]